MNAQEARDTAFQYNITSATSEYSIEYGQVMAKIEQEAKKGNYVCYYYKSSCLHKDVLDKLNADGFRVRQASNIAETVIIIRWDQKP